MKDYHQSVIFRVISRIAFSQILTVLAFAICPLLNGEIIRGTQDGQGWATGDIALPQSSNSNNAFSSQPARQYSQTKRRYPHTHHKNGVVVPDDGYQWASDDPNDFSVTYLAEGAPYPGYPHVVSSGNGSVHPAPGYAWVSDDPFQTKDYRVEPLKPLGTPHGKYPHVIWLGDGKFIPDFGWVWLSDNPDSNKDYRVVTRYAYEQKEIGEMNLRYGNNQKAITNFHAAMINCKECNDIPNAVDYFLIAQKRFRRDLRAKEEVKNVKSLLQQLNRSMQLEQKERKEWEKTSKETLEDSYKAAADATLGLLDIHLKNQLRKADKEVGADLTQLVAELDPDKREQLHAAFKVLKTRKTEYQIAVERVDKFKDALDVSYEQHKASEGREADSGVELAWKTCEKFHVLPPPLSKGKEMVEAWYNVFAQASSIERISQLNKNAEERLNAIKVLQRRMEYIVKLQAQYPEESLATKIEDKEKP